MTNTTSLYLTPDDYELAEKNGISESLVNSRFYKDGWEKERAITQPRRLKKWDAILEKYKDRLAVSKSVLIVRISRGWDEEKAATTPPVPQKQRRRQTSTKIPIEAIETAEQNGISKKTLRQRVYQYKWDIERAKTEPIHEHCRKRG